MPLTQGIALPQQYQNALALQAPVLGPVDLSGQSGPPGIPAPVLPSVSLSPSLKQQYQNAQAIQAGIAAMQPPTMASPDLSGNTTAPQQLISSIAPPALPRAIGVPGVASSPNSGDSQIYRDQDALNILRTTGAGVDQLHNPWARGFAKTADVLGSIFAPGLDAKIPGTTLHHDQLVNQAQQNLTNDQAAQQAQAQTAQTNAVTADDQAITNQRLHPRPEFQPLSTDDGIFAFNPTSGTASAVTGPNGESLSKPEKLDPHYVTQDDGSIVAITTDKTGKPSAQLVYQGNPKQETQIVPIDMGGVEHSVVVDKRTGSQLHDLGPTGNKPPSLSVNTGTYTLAEMPDGNGGTKTVLLNSKTGQVADAPQGLAKPGTAAKNAAVLQPVQAALDYATDYLKNGVFTGSGDEALMEKYFELAKPSTGFRMTQPQIDMEMKGRSWMNSLEAHMRHATVGTWFSDDQRKQITNTMQDLYNSKVNAAQGNGNAPTQFPPQNSGQPRAGASVAPPLANPPAGSIQVRIPGQNPGFIPRGALPQFRRDHPNAQVLQ